jgi:hypothetical protein
MDLEAMLVLQRTENLLPLDGGSKVRMVQRQEGLVKVGRGRYKPIASWIKYLDIKRVGRKFADGVALH